MESNNNKKGERIPLYFSSENQYLLDFINDRVNEVGTKMNRSKYLMDLIKQDYDRIKNNNNVTNNDLMLEIKELKSMIKDMNFVHISESTDIDIENEQPNEYEQIQTLSSEDWNDLDSCDF